MLPSDERHPPIIRSYADLLWFCAWMDAHAEVTAIQGWAVERLEGGGFCGLAGSDYRIGMDARELFAWRAAINDWTRAYRSREA